MAPLCETPATATYALLFFPFGALSLFGCLCDFDIVDGKPVDFITVR